MEADQLQEELLQLREILGCTQRDLAMWLECSQSHVARAELAERMLPRKPLKKLQELIEVVGEAMMKPKKQGLADSFTGKTQKDQALLQKFALVRKRSHILQQLSEMKKLYSESTLKSGYMASLGDIAGKTDNKRLKALLQKCVSVNCLKMLRNSPSAQWSLELSIAQIDGSIRALDQAMKK